MNVFDYENGLGLSIYISDQKFEDSMDLLLLMDDDKLALCVHQRLTDLCFTKHKIKTKNSFLKVVYSVLVAKTC